MSPALQLVLDLPSRPAHGRDDFFVAPANGLALALVDTWPEWPGRRLAVAGPQGSGKSHLVQVWATRTGAEIRAAKELAAIGPGRVAEDAALAVEDVDRLGDLPAAERAAAEEALFHLCNRLAVRGTLLVSGRRAPSLWTIALPDLASRLRAATVALLKAPDDALLAAVLIKLFNDRQIAVEPELVRYLLTRIERSFEAAETMVARLDRAGLARHRPITSRLAADVLRSDA